MTSTLAIKYMSDNRLVEVITQMCVCMKRFRIIDFNK